MTKTKLKNLKIRELRAEFARNIRMQYRQKYSIMPRKTLTKRKREKLRKEDTWD